jgi:hypothetical protein
MGAPVCRCVGVVGVSVCRCVGVSVCRCCRCCRCVGVWVCRCVGVSVFLLVGVSVFLFVGVSVCRCVGVCRWVGVSVCRCVVVSVFRSKAVPCLVERLPCFVYTGSPNVIKRLNMIDLLWQRELHITRCFARYLMADSSPQGGYNIYIVLEDRVAFLKGTSPSDRIRTFGDEYVARHLPLTTLGYGGANVLYKSLNTQHALALECGSQAVFDKARREVHGNTIQGCMAIGICIMFVCDVALHTLHHRSHWH